jgi:hypothetical protein
MACGGRSINPPSDDSTCSTDGGVTTSGEDSGSAATPDAGNSPSPAQIAALCGTWKSYEESCGAPTGAAACADALENCNTYAIGSWSSAWISALTSCIQAGQATCGFDPRDCPNEAANQLTPDPAQQSLAADYCSECAAEQTQTVAQCEAAFFGGSNGGAYGLPALIYNDAVVQLIDSECIALGTSNCGDNIAFCIAYSGFGACAQLL